MTWVTVPEASILAGRGRTQIYNWVQRGLVRAARAADNTIVIDAEHLLEIEPTITRGRPLGTARPNQHHGAPNLK